MRGPTTPPRLRSIRTTSFRDRTPRPKPALRSLGHLRLPVAHTAELTAGCAGDRGHRFPEAEPLGYAGRMAAPRAPAILLSLIISASGMLRAADARADEDDAPGADEAAAVVAFPDERFGPRYII